MDEKTKNLFADMLGIKENTKVSDTKLEQEIKIDSISDESCEIESNENSDNDDHKSEDDIKKENKSVKDTKKLSSSKTESFPKKDIGVGGASFGDEIIRSATPEIMEKIKSGEKTISGCWNWVYSFVKNEYIKHNGKINGGMWYDCKNLIKKYFDEIPEGTVCKEEKTSISSSTTSESISEVKKTVKRVSKKAAKEAKKESSEELKKDDKSKDDEEMKAYNDMISKIDFSKIGF